MDDDWDLHAVVRRYFAARRIPAAAADHDDDRNPFPKFPTRPLQNDHHFPATPSAGPGEQAFQPLLPIPPPAAAPFPPFPEIHHIQPSIPTNIQQNLQLIRNPRIPISSPNFPVTNNSNNPQPIRQRKRKNQQAKIVHQMTQEELSADSWAWRKYGQKPIKGSPYPRNYYRCSTSKGCAARRQVERSPDNPEIFLVSYTGEHTHPRPAHRSSLAGSSRRKLPAVAVAAAKTDSSTNAGVSSSTGSQSSASPTTAAQNEDAEMMAAAVEEDASGGDDDDDEFEAFHND